MTARNVLRIPTRADEVLCYELAWTEGTGKDYWSEACAVLRYPLPGLLPPIHIKPEGLFGLADSDIAVGWRGFNRDFDVKVDDERVGQAVLTKPVQEFLMDRLRGEHLVLDGDDIFLRIDQYGVGEVTRCVELMGELATLIPATTYE